MHDCLFPLQLQAKLILSSVLSAERRFKLPDG